MNEKILVGEFHADHAKVVQASSAACASSGGSTARGNYAPGISEGANVTSSSGISRIIGRDCDRGRPLQSEGNIKELNAMWSRLHGDHFIMAFPSFDTATNRWAPQADVSWNHNSPRRKFAFIRFSNRFKTEAEAVAFALDMTPVWIERHGERLHSAAGPELMRVIDVMEALKESMARTASKQPRRAVLRARERVAPLFTFDQFKSLIAQKGLRLGNQTLQKSYAALVKLRREKRLSWAETRHKVEVSQLCLPGLQAAARRPKAARIPLTKRDWRNTG